MKKFQPLRSNRGYWNFKSLYDKWFFCRVPTATIQSRILKRVLRRWRGAMASVPTATIQSRILKRVLRRWRGAMASSSNRYDPIEDTETSYCNCKGLPNTPFQPLRSNRGYWNSDAFITYSFFDPFQPLRSNRGYWNIIAQSAWPQSANVPTATIQSRIVKPSSRVPCCTSSTSSNRYDPIEDTETTGTDHQDLYPNVPTATIQSRILKHGQKWTIAQIT